MESFVTSSHTQSLSLAWLLPSVNTNFSRQSTNNSTYQLFSNQPSSIGLSVDNSNKSDVEVGFSGVKNFHNHFNINAITENERLLQQTKSSDNLQVTKNNNKLIQSILEQSLTAEQNSDTFSTNLEDIPNLPVSLLDLSKLSTAKNLDFLTVDRWSNNPENGPLWSRNVNEAVSGLNYSLLDPYQAFNDTDHTNVSFELLGNVTSTDLSGSLEDPIWQIVLIILLKIVVMGGIIVVAVMGNILVIVSISLNRKLRSLANHFLISLAVADIMVAVCAMTFNASVQIFGKWMFGTIVCDLWNSFDVYFSTVSILHLCCISMDRYYAILKPLEYPLYMTRRVVFVMIASSWLLPFLISFVPIFLGWYARPEYLQNRVLMPDSCTFEVNTTFALISSALSFWCPCTVMVVTYFKIFQEARKQEAAILSRTNSSSNVTNARRGPHYKYRRLLAYFSRSFNHHRDAPERHQLRHLPALAEATMKSRCQGRNTHYQNRPSVTESVISMTRCSLGSSPCLCSLSEKEIFIEKYGTLPSDRSRRVSLPIHDHSNTTHPPLCDAPVSATKIQDSSTTNIEVTIPSNRRQDHPPVDDQVLGMNFSTVSSNNDHTTPSSPGVRYQYRSGSTEVVHYEPQHPRHSGNSGHSGQHAPTLKREHKAARTLGIIMGAFILCWLPFFTWYVTSNVCGEACPTPEPVVTLLFWIGYFNSTLNPFIYAYFRADFREAFRKTLKKMRCPCFNTQLIL